MGGRSRRNRKRQKTATAAPKPPRKLLVRSLAEKAWRHKGRTVLFSTTAIAAAVLGVWANVAAFQPALVVEPRRALDPNNLFLCVFEVTNTGPVDVSDLSYRSVLRDVTLSNSEFHDCAAETRHSGIQQLEAGEKTTLQLPFPFANAGQVVEADVDLVVCYRYWWQLFKREHTFRFVAVRDRDGVVEWHPIAKSQGSLTHN